ncbi:E3 ubiquitin-protein ligase RNF31 isoform X5 [Patagioenas fasciata]|uniref:E3 ubiquitin-protein ligase RNF31 isoform X5 n=1 Tax=Patagioenas fasciata TaxID=372321 RepID=UPI003A9A3F5E
MAELGALWGALWGALVRDPQDPSPPELQPLLLVPRPPRDKWRLLDVGEILRGNVRVAPGAPPIPPLDVGAPPGALGALRTALSILEKYGRNLLQPRPPRHWRLVRFGNPVFRRTVGAMQGGRAVLRLLGYTHESPEGLGFPPGAVAPDVPRVAAVTAELLLLRMEIDLLLANQHPNPQFFTQMLLGSEEPLAPDSPAVADAEAPKHESPAEDPGWACASCTFLNQGPSVLCGVCERPRLARRPQSPPAAPSPAPPIEAPPPEAPPTKAPPSADSTPSDPALSSPAQRGPARELERQRRLREEGRRVVEIVREAEAQGVAPEAVVGVAWALGGPVGVAVGVAKAALGEALAALAGAGQGAGLGPLSIREAGLAWGHAHGHAQRALQAAIGRRRRQLQALAALGFPEVGVAGPALLQNGGNLWGALRDLQRQKLRPLLLGQWESTEPHIDFQGPDPQVPIRRCLAFLGLRSWGRAQLLVTLARELGALGEPPELRELLEAVGGCTDPRALRRRLRCRCRLCGWDMARKQAQWLTGCECPLCPDCFRGHFQVGVKEKGVQDLVCPACGKPDLADEGARTCYFSTLDTQLRQVLDPPTYQLFCQKLTELELQKDPQFLWCTKRCPGRRCPLGGSLHAHHPRHCLFFLRDWERPRLQRLLQMGGVPFTTEAPPGSSGRCEVMEQKETGEGLQDAPCGRDVGQGQAGMCGPHYTEYLVGLIRSRSLDPAPLYTWPEVLAAAERHLPGGRPPQGPEESDAQYGQRLRHLLESEDPIKPRPEAP